MCKNCFECKNAEITFKDVMKIHKNSLKNIEIKNKDLPNDFKKISENSDSCLGDMYGKCLKGDTEKLIKHYKENGHLRKLDCKIEMDCFEPTDFAIATDNLFNTMNKLLDNLTEKSI